MHQIKNKKFRLKLTSFVLLAIALSCSDQTSVSHVYGDTIIVETDESILYSPDLLDPIPGNIRDSGPVGLANANCNDSLCQIRIPFSGGSTTLGDLQQYANTFDGRIKITIKSDDEGGTGIPDITKCRPGEPCVDFPLPTGYDPDDASSKNLSDIAEGKGQPQLASRSPMQQPPLMSLDVTPYLNFDIPIPQFDFSPFIKQQQDATDAAIAAVEKAKADYETAAIAVLTFRANTGKLFSDYRKQIEDLIGAADIDVKANSDDGKLAAALVAASAHVSNKDARSSKRKESIESSRKEMPRDVPAGYNNLKSSPTTAAGKQIRNQITQIEYIKSNSAIMTESQRSNLKLAQETIQMADSVSDDRSEQEMASLLALVQAYIDLASGKFKPQTPCKFTYPLNYAGPVRVTTLYGAIDASHPRPHGGTDIGVPLNTPIVSPVFGVVKEKGYQPGGYGHYIIVEYNTPDDQTHTVMLAHMVKASNLPSGSFVSPGQLLGLSGSSGHSTGPHLHIEIRDCTGINNCISTRPPARGGAPRVDPNPWLFEDGVCN